MTDDEKTERLLEMLRAKDAEALAAIGHLMTDQEKTLYGLAAEALSSARAQTSDYLIWSNEHRAWWRPNRAGYTIHLPAAGRYARDEAISICRDARGGWHPGQVPPEMPVPESDLPQGHEFADVANADMNPGIKRTPFFAEFQHDAKDGGLITADIRDQARTVVGSVMVRPLIRPNDETEAIARLWAAAPSGFWLAAQLAIELNRGMRGRQRDAAITAIQAGDLDAMQAALTALRGTQDEKRGQPEG